MMLVGLSSARQGCLCTHAYTCLQALHEEEDLRGLAPLDVPLLGVGHSMGALMHLLIGSRHAGSTSGNVVISFNNK